jgi:hypothetical protein
MQIGDTLYNFDVNRRVYTKPENGFGKIIYSKHFHPLKIIGETRMSWLLEHGYRAKKKGDDPMSRGGFYTAEEMADNIWVNDHRHKVRDLLDRAPAEQIRQVAAVLGYQHS